MAMNGPLGHAPPTERAQPDGIRPYTHVHGVRQESIYSSEEYEFQRGPSNVRPSFPRARALPRRPLN